jgi:hypothetical protein
LTRPLAYAAAQGAGLPIAPLGELHDRQDDPAITLWADFALAATPPGDRAAAAELAATAASDRPERALAAKLLDALHCEGDARLRRLDEATLWLRTHDPEAAKVWAGWAVEGERLVRVPRPL